jgi:chromate transport protein ChrA
MLELVARFLTIGALAFGSGQAALPLVECLAVADTVSRSRRRHRYRRLRNQGSI